MLLPIALLVLVAQAQAAEPFVGFSPEAALKQREIEARFDAALDPNDQRAWMKEMTAAPNHVSSPHNKANAEAILAQFQSWGWDAHIETFQVLYPTPVEVQVEMVAPTQATAHLRENNFTEGPDAAVLKDALPAYNVFSGDGDVTADVVYVNYGMPDDYKELERRGIDVRGKVVLARYGGGWRGLKPKLAAEHGAVACLIYSDPRDDGYFVGNSYPNDANRPLDGLQRGSVNDITLYSGDPLTPGAGAVKSAKRLAIKDVKTLPRIPVLPIAYRDAQPMLEALTGPVAPPGWRGALPFTYHIGPGPTKVHVKVQSEWSLKDVHNVIAMMPGSEAPDEWVIRGNHHDAWVMGAHDPFSGHGAMMAEAKAIGALVKQGLHPHRTIVYASWDAEEPGLLGSVEWVETHADELKQKAVVYINSDTNGRGLLNVDGTQALQRMVNEVAEAVKDPQTNASVGERKRAKQRADGYARRAAGIAGTTADRAAERIITVRPMGSGSDYTPFAQHLGIAALDLGFSGENDLGGVYHSSYDTYDTFTKFGDPDFKYGIALAQVAGRAILRTANAERLPFAFGDQADGIGRYLDEVKRLTDARRALAEDLGQLLDDKAFELAADPLRQVGPPQRDDHVPYINLSPLENAVARLRRAGAAFDRAIAGTTLVPGQTAMMNVLLKDAEQLLTDTRGLPNRSWYTHMIFAPGLFAGYGAKTLPGLREAIEEHQYADADKYAVIIAARVEAYAERLERATAVATATKPGN